MWTRDIIKKETLQANLLHDFRHKINPAMYKKVHYFISWEHMFQEWVWVNIQNQSVQFMALTESREKLYVF